MQERFVVFPKLRVAQSLQLYPKIYPSLLRRAAGVGVLTLALMAAAVGTLSTTAFAKSVPLKQVELSAAEQQASDITSAAGLVVVAVDAEGPAAQAGIVRGDILLRVNGVDIDAAVTLYEVVTGARPGDEVSVEVQHGDETRTLTVALGERGDRAYLGIQVVDAPGGVAVETVAPNMVEPGVVEPSVVEPGGAAEAATEVVTEVVTATSGVTVGAAGHGDVMLFGPGLIVAEVLAESPAAVAGVQPGDLILQLDGQPVATPEDLLALLHIYNPGDMVTLTVQKGGVVGASILQLPITLGAAPEEATRAYLGILVVMSPAGMTEALPAMPAMPAPGAGTYSSPAIPVAPPIPAYPEYAPGYARDICGAVGGNVTINQYFTLPAPGTPLAVSPSTVSPSTVSPSIVALPPMAFAQPALPADPYYVYHSGVNPEAYRVAGTANVVAHDVMITRADPVMPGEVAVWKHMGEGAQQDVVIVRQAGEAPAAWSAMPTQPTEQPHVIWRAPVETVPGQGAVVVYRAEASASDEVAKSVTIQMAPTYAVPAQVAPAGQAAPTSSWVTVVPIDPATGSALPQAAPAMPVVPELWY